MVGGRRCPPLIPASLLESQYDKYTRGVHSGMAPSAQNGSAKELSGGAGGGLNRRAAAGGAVAR